MNLMRKRLFTLGLPAMAALLLSVVIAGHASATPSHKLDLKCDVGLTCNPASPIDMEGPVIGFVNYNQDDVTGDLRLEIKINGGAPAAGFTIYLVCGPTHETACGFDSFGTMTTNAQGNSSSSALVIPKCTAQAILSPNGPAMLGHIDLISGANVELYAATTVDFNETVGPACAPAIAPQSVQPGDPLNQ